MKTKTAHWVLGIIIVLVVIGIFVNSNNVDGSSGQGIKITVYKSVSCGCCEGYINELKGNGFNVDLKVVEDISKIKDKYNVPIEVQSCHMSLVEGYFVEGHVPIEAVNKLLQEKPDVDGIVLPGMPAGAPGMSGIKSGEFVVLSVKDGVTSEFMRI